MTTLNPADKSGNVTLSNGNLSANGIDGTHGLCRSTTSKTGGKAFVQMHIANATSLMVLGVADASASITDYVSFDTHSAGWANTTGGWYWNGGGTAGDYPTSGTGHDIGLGIDFDTPGSGQATVQINVDGGTYTSHVENVPPTGPWFIIIDVGANADLLTMNFGGSAFVGSPPSGHPAWDGAAQISGSLASTLGALTVATTAKAIISGTLSH